MFAISQHQEEAGQSSRERQPLLQWAPPNVMSRWRTFQGYNESITNNTTRLVAMERKKTKLNVTLPLSSHDMRVIYAADFWPTITQTCTIHKCYFRTPLYSVDVSPWLTPCFSCSQHLMHERTLQPSSLPGHEKCSALRDLKLLFLGINTM